MKLPQVVILELDGWLAKQLRELAGESRWLIQQTRSVDTAMSLVRDRRPTVLIVQVEPGEDRPEPLKLIAEVHRLTPDVPVMAVSDVKLPDAERAAWTAALLDLGSRYVLFPPLMKTVLEDVVSGMMATAIRVVVGESNSSPRSREEGIIDLAEGRGSMSALVDSLPVLSPARCIGCGDCVAICPTDCLAMGASLPWLPRPLDCVSCTLCELICPTAAIQIASPN